MWVWLTDLNRLLFLDRRRNAFWKSILIAERRLGSTNLGDSWQVSNRLSCGQLTVFLSCVEICGFVCSAIREICDLRIIFTSWAVVWLSFEENSKIHMQLISRKCEKHLGLGERSGIYRSEQYVATCQNGCSLLWEPREQPAHIPFSFVIFRIFVSSVFSGAVSNVDADVVNLAVLTRSMCTLWKHQINYIDGEYLCMLVCIEARKHRIASERL